MNKLVAGLFILTVIGGCNKNLSSYDYQYGGIYSESAEGSFRNFIFILQPYLLENGEKRYVYNDSLSEVNLEINQQNWGAFSSLPLDSAAHNLAVSQNYRLSGTPLSYAVIAPYALPEDTLLTAGDFQKALFAVHTLEPGDYIARISSVKLHRLDGSIQIVRPVITTWVEIKEGEVSAFIGEFEIKID